MVLNSFDRTTMVLLDFTNQINQFTSGLGLPALWLHVFLALPEDEAVKTSTSTQRTTQWILLTTEFRSVHSLSLWNHLLR